VSAWKQCNSLQPRKDKSVAINGVATTALMEEFATLMVVKRVSVKLRVMPAHLVLARLLPALPEKASRPMIKAVPRVTVRPAVEFRVSWSVRTDLCTRMAVPSVSALRLHDPGIVRRRRAKQDGRLENVDLLYLNNIYEQF